MLTKHKNLSKSKRREIKKKGYYKMKNIIKNNASKEERKHAPTLTLAKAIRFLTMNR